MHTLTLRVNCDDYCSDCGRCHNFQSRGIEWGNLAPKCLLDGLDDNDLAVSCQGNHNDFD
jgi:hypothetical protein